jgi:hypothetical protein
MSEAKKLYHELGFCTLRLQEVPAKKKSNETNFKFIVSLNSEAN